MAKKRTEAGYKFTRASDGWYVGAAGVFQVAMTGEARFHHIGSFPTPEEGHVAYVEAADRLFGEFTQEGIA